MQLQKAELHTITTVLWTTGKCLLKITQKHANAVHAVSLTTQLQLFPMQSCDLGQIPAVFQICAEATPHSVYLTMECMRFSANVARAQLI